MHFLSHQPYALTLTREFNGTPTPGSSQRAQNCRSTAGGPKRKPTSPRLCKTLCACTRHHRIRKSVGNCRGAGTNALAPGLLRAARFGCSAHVCAWSLSRLPANCVQPRWRLISFVVSGGAAAPAGDGCERCQCSLLVLLLWSLLSRPPDWPCIVRTPRGTSDALVHVRSTRSFSNNSSKDSKNVKYHRQISRTNTFSRSYVMNHAIQHWGPKHSTAIWNVPRPPRARN